MVPTVRIKHAVVEGNPHGYVDINKSDYDANPGAYELVGAAPSGKKDEGDGKEKDKGNGKTGKKNEGGKSE